MNGYPNLTIQIGNFNGFRNPIRGKGRIQTTIESLLESCPAVTKTRILLVDNESDDGSKEYLYSLPFGDKFTVKRHVVENTWEATTRNNMVVLKDTVNKTQSEFIWRIENDSFFYNKNSYVNKAIEILENYSDIHIVHLRRWTTIDAKDRPGVGRNLNRVSEIRTAPSGFEFYVIEKCAEDSNWIPVGEDLGDHFVPDEESGYGFCHLGGVELYSVRIKEDGSYERLLADKWATYTNHGWIARKQSLDFVFRTYDPSGEQEMADAFKKHFNAAKLDEDAFIQFGWKTRYPNWSEGEALEIFEWARRHNHESCKDYGLFHLK